VNANRNATIPLKVNKAESRPAAVAALASGAKRSAAAEAAGVARSTLWRWMQDPEFVGTVEEARAALLDRLLDDALGDAVESAAVLRELRDSPEAAAAEGAATRLRAAQTLYRVAMDGIRARLMPAGVAEDLATDEPVELRWPDYERDAG
jgi:hypothetical protein